MILSNLVTLAEVANSIGVLEINNPPEGRCGIVVNEYDCGDSVFTEWETLKNACDAFTRYWGSL